MTDEPETKQTMAAHIWMGSHRSDLYERLEYYWSDPDALVDQLHREIRAGRQFADLSTDCTQDEVADILDTWERHARRTVVSRVRDDLGISQQEFAERLGLYGQQTISKYERGITTPSRTVVKLAVSLARDDHE